MRDVKREYLAMGDGHRLPHSWNSKLLLGNAAEDHPHHDSVPLDFVGVHGGKRWPVEPALRGNRQAPLGVGTDVRGDH
jgi:hypothetical protein